MRCIPNLVLVAMLAFAFGIHTSFAQNKEVTFADVGKLEQNAMHFLQGIPYRSIWTSWVFPERGKEHSYKSVMTRETDGAGRTRSVQDNETPGSFKRMEVISIDDQNYRKLDQRKWELLPPPPSYQPPVAPDPPPGSKPQFENRACLVETLNDGKVSVYETVNRSTREEDGKQVVRIHTNKFWFRFDGMLLRKDAELEVIGETRILKNSMVYEYESIKIEAPKLDQ